MIVANSLKSNDLTFKSSSVSAALMVILRGKSCSDNLRLMSLREILPLEIFFPNPENILYKSEIIMKIGNEIRYLFFFCNLSPNLKIVLASCWVTLLPGAAMFKPQRSPLELMVESAHSDQAMMDFLMVMYSIKLIWPSKSRSTATMRSLARL